MIPGWIKFKKTVKLGWGKHFPTGPHIPRHWEKLAQWVGQLRKDFTLLTKVTWFLSCRLCQGGSKWKILSRILFLKDDCVGSIVASGREKKLERRAGFRCFCCPGKRCRGPWLTQQKVGMEGKWKSKERSQGCAGCQGARQRAPKTST